MTEARKLGVNPPVRTSGDLEGSSPVTLIGPKGELHLDKGLIIADRHIHMTPKDAEEFGVKNGDIVKVATGREGRKVVFDDVVIRVREDFALAMHIDTDESNAGMCSGEVYGEIVK